MKPLSQDEITYHEQMRKKKLTKTAKKAESIEIDMVETHDSIIVMEYRGDKEINMAVMSAN